MANEVLTREPTSSGNRKKFTWAGWIKRNSLNSQGGNFFQGIFAVGTVDGAEDTFMFSGDQLRLRCETGTDIVTADEYRDCGNWMHLMMVVDTTLYDPDHRCIFYVNGVKSDVMSTENDITQNADLRINSAAKHYIGEFPRVNEHLDGQIYDVFLVDGQALTPDVFGFYKDGDGYQSSGTTQATDFKPGQWSPHSPRKIKSDIERRGGFGVNGFYLPMNDISNPGADFHCAPNSIIKLKGEDLPQPRNGAPTTSDAYVSELRQEQGTLGFDGVVKFDGSGDYLSIPSSNDFNLDNTWTIEYFFYNKDTGVSRLHFFHNDKNNIQTATNGTQLLFYNGSSATTFGGISLYKWHHLAVVNSSGTVTFYIDGKSAGTASAGAVSAATALTIGAYSDGQNPLDGFISNFRVVNGTAVYTSNFTPPTEPLANVTNTKLLCCNSSTSATAATVTPGTITANGNAFATRNELTGSLILACPFVAGGFGQNGAVNSTIPGLGDYHIALGGPSSIPAVNFLAGTGTQATITGDNGLYYGSSLDVSTSSIRPRATVGTAFTPDGDYTVEFWCYINSFNAGGSHIIQYDQDNGATGWLISFDSGTFRWMLRNSSNQDVQVSVSTVVKSGQWNHIACVYDSSKNQISGYLNGVAVGRTPIAANYISTQYTSLNRIHIGTNAGDGSRPMQGYLQDLRIYKGLAKYKGGFDVPKPYTPVGIEAFRTTADTCKNNFATLNAIDNDGGVLSNGNLTYGDAGSDGWNNSRATIGASSGKWYWEMRVDAINQVVCASVAGPAGNDSTNGARLGYLPGQNDDAGVTYYDDGRLYHADSQSGGQAGWGAAYGATDVIGIALDMDDSGGKVWFSKNGSWQASGNPSTGANPARSNLKTYADTYFPTSGTYFANTTQTFNFGQNPSFSGTVTAGTNADDSGKGLFKYAPPSGFLALCEDNLPTPAIADPGDHFKTVLYTGDGNEGHSITGVGFKPDLVWVKCRSHSDNHTLSDTVRGPGLALYSDLTNSENESYIRIQSFNDNGFTTGSSGDTNTSGRTFCAWCWKAGGAAVTNTDGTITSQVSANQTAGFSIVSYTGTETNGTVGHGLGKRPKMVLVKRRNGASTNWPIWFDGVSTNTDKVLQLNLTNAEAAAATFFNSSDTTTTTFPVGTGGGQTNTDNMIAYCWAEIEGYSKFGSYVGNASADGTFVYCGFKPAWVMIKTATGTDQWVIFDSSRNSTNPAELILRPNLSNVENTESGAKVDLLSNGFKLRGSGGGQGQTNSANTFIFMAFAESPFQTANAK